MRKLVVTGILALNIFTALSVHNPVRAEDDRDCIMAVTKAQRQLEAGRALEVTMRSFDISKFQSDYPENRPMSYQFVMSGKAAGAVMNSPKLMKEVAGSVIQSCSSVGKVTFGVYQTGWGISVGVFPGGRVDVFECVESQGRNSPKLSWGQEFCSL